MGIVVFPLLLVASVGALYLQKSVWILFSAMVVGIGLAYGFSLILAQPLKQLLVVIQRVKGGDLSARVRAWSKDEIGQVQSAFNDMVEELEQSQNKLLTYNRELNAVNELAEALTLGQGIDAVIETALKRVICLTGTDVGTIYLLDKDEMKLKLRASQGFLSPELLEAITGTEKENYPLQSLLSSGHAFAIEDVRATKELPPAMAELLYNEGFISWACAPLKMEGEVTGVYHLGRRDKRTFSSHDLALLEVIGNVVGSSLSSTQLLRDLRHKETELRRALHRAVELQEEERKRLARELHDEVGQALTSILIRLKTLQDEKNIQEINDRLDDLRLLTAQTIEELRRLAMDLRPVTLDSLGIIPALRWYAQQCSERTGLDIQFFGPEECERLSPETELFLYRVAQEGITNSIRHGKAKKIEVILEKEPRTLCLTIKDNGRGFSTVALDHGLGLVGIRERVELLNGKFSIHTAPGAGTQLWIKIPLKR